jgi:hypothetical protein
MISLHALHCRACPVSLLTAVPCVKMMPENNEMKLIFKWLVSDIIFLLSGELSLLHKLFTVCFVGYNILAKY